MVRRAWLRFRAWVRSDAGVAWHGAVVAVPFSLPSAVGLNAFAADCAARGDWWRAAACAAWAHLDTSGEPASLDGVQPPSSVEPRSDTEPQESSQ